MSRKKHAAEHVNHERWLVSYADFITLLFAFFVVLFASSQVDRSKTKKMALAINSAFQEFSIFKEQSGDTLEAEGGGMGGNAKKFREYLLQPDSSKSIIMPPELSSEEVQETAPTGDPKLSQNTGMVTPQEEALARVQRTLMDMIARKKINGNVEVFFDNRGLVISIRDAIIFEAGADKVLPRSEAMLNIVGPVLASMPNQIKVEGHTDDQGVSGNFKSNWELSAARSAYVINWLIQKNKIEPERFIAVGYGPYRPIASNATEEGRQKNRRVDIILLTDESASKEAQVPKPESIQKKVEDVALPGNTEMTLPQFKEKKLPVEKNKPKEIDEIRKLFTKSNDKLDVTKPKILESNE